MKSSNQEVIQKLRSVFGDRIEQEKNLFPFLTMRIPTVAQYYFEAKSREDLIQAKKAADILQIPFTIIGGGSNIVIFKKELSGLAVRNLYVTKKVLIETNTYVDLLVSSGFPMSRLVSETVQDGYEGLEYHKGLPGTVGGAVYMNSKWTKPLNYVGDLVQKAFVLAKDHLVKELGKDYFEFGYDYSKLQDTKELLLEVVFRLRKSKPEILKKRSEEAFEYRKKTQPMGVVTCGCFFRNISAQEREKGNFSTTSVGYLIDKLGLKGTRIGGFAVSDLHANFIVNIEKEKSNIEDLKRVVTLVKDRVRRKFGVELKEEVVIL